MKGVLDLVVGLVVFAHPSSLYEARSCLTAQKKVLHKFFSL